MPPQGSNVGNFYRLRLKGFPFFFHRLHLRQMRLLVTCFHWHEAQHCLIRMPKGFLT